jgi:hypothetical protein
MIRTAEMVAGLLLHCTLHPTNVNNDPELLYMQYAAEL